MSFKRILGILLVVIGVGLFYTGNYIEDQVNQGKIKIKKAEKFVDQTQSLSSLNPVTKQIGEGITDSANQKIDAGKQEVMKYEDLASKLKMGGMASAILGIALIVFGRKKK